MKLIISRYKYEGLIVLLWFVVIALINPVGDFPLNDDWCYAKSVKNYIETNNGKELY